MGEGLPLRLRPGGRRSDVRRSLLPPERTVRKNIEAASWFLYLSTSLPSCLISCFVFGERSDGGRGAKADP